MAATGLLAIAGANPGATGAEVPKEEEIRESVVKVFTTSRLPDPFRPWQKQNAQESTGTGVVIDGKRILTNAHVVFYATQVSVQPNQSSDKVNATVEAIAPGIDLAILSLEDESFFEKRPPIPMAEKLPEVKDSVVVYGYPTGGTSLSITKGAVNRIEFAPYGQGTAGLRIQVDAAINPGNSGGPALVDNKIIGLTFSRLGGADNIGYIIPTEEIRLFLKDVADGKYDGKPNMFDLLQTLENAALRAKLNFPKKSVGMVVHEPAQKDEKYPLKKWDIITKVGDTEVDNTGLVTIGPNLRVRFQYLLQKLTKDGKVPMTVFRDGKEIPVQVPVSGERDDLIKGLRGKYPSYFLYGPLVFSPVTAEYMAGIERSPGASMLLALIGSPLITRRGEEVAFPGEELVVVSSQMFAHAIGKGYSNPFAKVVKEVNGVKIKNLKHMVETLRDTKEKFITIQFNDRNSETIVFNRQEVLKAMDDILSDNSVRQQASDDLLSVWKKEK